MSSVDHNDVVDATTEDDAIMQQNSFVMEGTTGGESDNYVKNASTMYQLIMEGSWDAVIEQCKVAPKEAKQWVVRGNIDSWRRLPLHEACIRQANVDVIKALVDAFPLAAKSFDHSARLPLHHACFHGCSIEVIRALVGAYPSGLEKKDVFEKTPLILAGSSSSKHKSLIIETLMKGPAECIIEGYRVKWEKEKQVLLSTLQEQFHQEKSALEHKVKNISEESKRQAYHAEKEIGKKNSNIDELNKVIFDLNGQVEALTNTEKNLKLKIKDMEDRFSNLCVTNHVTYKKQQDKALEQESTIASLEANIEELNNNLMEMNRKVNEKNISNAKLTKQVAELRATALDQKNKEDTLQQEITKYRADLTASRREVLALVQKSTQSNEREKEMESQIKELTNELEGTKLSNSLLQETNGSLQEHISKMTVTHEEETQGSINTQKKLEHENEQFKEELNYLKRELEEKEKAITFMGQSSTSDREASTNRIKQLEVMLENVTATLRAQETNHEEEKQRLLKVISTLNEDADRVKEEVQMEQAKAQETIRLFKSALRKFTGDLSKAGGAIPVLGDMENKEN